jgi:hypothetical protein
MNEAIKLAIEKGGYKLQVKHFSAVITNPAEIENWDKVFEFIRQEDLENYIILDPLFWQALGKALGWYRKPNKNTYRDGAKVTQCGREDGSRNNHWYCPHSEKYEWDVDFYPMWLFFALQYTETVLRKGDTEKFWKEIL